MNAFIVHEILCFVDNLDIYILVKFYFELIKSNIISFFKQSRNTFLKIESRCGNFVIMSANIFVQCGCI